MSKGVIEREDAEKNKQKDERKNNAFLNFERIRK